MLSYNKYNANFVIIFRRTSGTKIKTQSFDIDRYLPFEFRFRNIERCILSKLPTTYLLAHQIFYLKMCSKKSKINRKFRVPRKQGAHFLGARAQNQDPWVFSSSAWNSRSIEYHHALYLEFETLAGLGSGPHVQLTMTMYL
jgi:hypothetical protein